MHCINSVIKETTREYENCNANKILRFDGYVKVKEHSYARFESIPILYNIDSK